MKSGVRCVVGITLLCLMWSIKTQAENWPRFRGPNGTGISSQKGIPATWTDADYAWKIQLTGEGHSSPIVWRDTLFVTSAIDEGSVRYLACLDGVTGQQRWIRSIEMARSTKHLRNSWASTTPTTDGKLVYTTVADVEHYLVLAYDFEGTAVWRRDLGRFESQHNLGVSPILVGGKLIVPNDQVGSSAIVALNPATGEIVWSTARESRETSYATPFLMTDQNDREQLICVSGVMGIAGLNPETGKMYWNSGPFPLRTVASPIQIGELVMASCGQGGRMGVLQLAVDPTGRGDVSKTHVRWQRKRHLPYVPCPVSYGGYVFDWCDEGIVSCLDPVTGQDVWTERVGGSYSASPVCIDGRLFCISDDGTVVVVAAEPTFRLLGKTPLGESTRATAAIANERLYLRTFHRLFCVKAIH